MKVGAVVREGRSSVREGRSSVSEGRSRSKGR